MVTSPRGFEPPPNGSYQRPKPLALSGLCYGPIKEIIIVFFINIIQMPII